MNILIPDSWLKEFLKTKVPAPEIARSLLLCGPSVERVKPADKDWIYDIEITTNRSDTASIIGIAREANAILPQFNYKSKLVLPEIKIPKKPKSSLPLKVTIKPASICPRFSAIILDNVSIRPSPQLIKSRLEKAGIRSLNNMVDISNYLMLETGQPIHTFDYDQISGSTMKLRLSKPGETVTTLDNIKRTLPGGDIVIEDGKGKIIDLCGIMGAKNSAIRPETKKVIFFVQSYDPVLIRRTSMQLALRTEAAVRFEKGVDEKTIPEVIWRGLTMAREYCSARLASRLYDIYPNPAPAKNITARINFINERLGIELKPAKVKLILESLGFNTVVKNDTIISRVPTWRLDDINIPEDLLEEVARIYGYHNLPSVIPTSYFSNRNQNIQFYREQQIKTALKYWGYTEIYNYSFISQKLMEQCNLTPANSLKLSNPLSSDWVYLRPSLIPSLLNVVKENQNHFPEVKIFELANTYLKKKADLPEENLTLSGLATLDFYNLKGLIESLIIDLGITDYAFVAPEKETPAPFRSTQTAQLIINKQTAGFVGEIKTEILSKLEVKPRLAAFELKAQILSQAASGKKIYRSISTYPPVIEDLTFTLPEKTPLGKVIQLIKQVDQLVHRIDLIDCFENNFTFRIEYQSSQKNLSAEDVTKIRSRIINQTEKNFGAKLK